MRARVTYAWPLLVMVLLCGLTLWLEQVIDTPAPSAGPRLRHDADSVVERLTLTQLGPDGKPQTRLSAQRMVHFADDDQTELSSPQLMRSDGGVTLSVRSDRGLLSHDSKDARFYDNVELVRREASSPDELQIRTQYLDVLVDRELLTTDRPVTIRQGASVLSGVGMAYDRKTGRLALHSGVKATFVPKPGR